MNYKVSQFIDNLLIYDYILFGAIILLFILFLILAILVRKHMIFAVLIIIFSLFFVMLGPLFGYKAMHSFLFKNHIDNISVKKLEFNHALLVKGTLINDSKKRFKKCKIKASVFKVSHNELFDMLYPLNPFKTKSHYIDLNISKNQSQEFKFFVEPFYYKKDYNVSLKGSCE